MKRYSAPSQDTRNDHSELPVRLYRAISDVMRQLDDERSRTEEVADLFTPHVETQRMKLRDYCDKLMFTAPVTHGKKAEDILWRKVYYEVVSTVKRLNKSMKLGVKDSSMIEAHLQCGIGFYHHLIMKLQSQFHLDLRGIVDFPIVVTDRGLKKDKVVWSSTAIESGALEWANNALHRCLIYLGDIRRYLTELDSNKGHSSAERYYTQALHWKPECGTPHNQLGNLSTNKNFSLNAAYHFMRCLSSVDKFEGAEGNLMHLMENNARVLDEQTRLQNQSIPVPNLKKMITSFLHISYGFFFDKDEPRLTQLCGDVFIAFEACMDETFAQKNGIVNSTFEPTILRDDMLFKMIVITILCITQLKTKNSQQLMGGVALFLALMSQVLHFAVKRLEMTLPPPTGPLPLKNILFERRRRKRRTTMSSDLSEEDDEDDIGSDVSAEENLIFDECVDSEDELGAVNGKTAPVIVNGFNKPDADNHSSKPWELPVVAKNKTFQHIHKLSEDSFIFQTVKVGFDWIESNQPILKSCEAATGQLMSRLVAFLNHLCMVPGHDHIKQYYDEDIPTAELLRSIPLQEDAHVRGLPDLQLAQSKLNWDHLRTRSVKPIEETYCRMITLIGFGKQLASSDICSLHFNKSKLWFSCDTTVNGHGNNLEAKDRHASFPANDNMENHKNWNGFKLGPLPIGLSFFVNFDWKKTNGFKEASGGQLPKNDACKAEFEKDLKKLNFQKINGLLMVNLKRTGKETISCNNKTNEDVGTKDDITTHKYDNDREKLMHQLGKLWLKSEVSHLEDKTRKVVKDSLSPYLVPDSEAFLHHPSLIKQLMCSKKFIILIPTIVLSALDECKQSSSIVRDTLRWLEWQLRNGKRNVRLQRSNEHLQVPYIKLPKKKDKEAWMFMHVVECCNYLCNQSTGEKNPELVTLLTGSKSLLPNGSNSSQNGFNLIGLAKSAGINVEHIEAFFSKWKSSSKSHG